MKEKLIHHYILMKISCFLRKMMLYHVKLIQSILFILRASHFKFMILKY